jgi:uncharacterized protein (TIGR00251 family)
MNRETGEWCCSAAAGVRVTVQVQPNARKTEVVGLVGDALKIRLQAQPVEGKANEALIRAIAGYLDVPRSAVLLTHGQTSRRKLLEIRSRLSADEVMQALLKAITG